MIEDHERFAKLERVEGEARSLGYSLSTPAELQALRDKTRELADRIRNHPIPMRLHCPECRALHVDEGEFATKPHHTHACQHCGNVWRPALVNTLGVQFLPGFKNGEPRSETTTPQPDPADPA